MPPGSSAVTATPASSVSGNNAELKLTPVTSNVLPQVISAAESTAKVAGEDDEMAKRQARAARFGIPVVEPKKPPTSKGTEMQPQINTADSELVREATGPFIESHHTMNPFRRPKRPPGRLVSAFKMQAQNLTHQTLNLRWMPRRRRRKGNELNGSVSKSKRSVALLLSHPESCGRC